MKNRTVDTSLSHGRCTIERLHEATAPGAGFLVGIPVECGREYESLGIVEAHGMDVRDEHQQRRELLTGLNDTELVGLLDRVDRIG